VYLNPRRGGQIAVAEAARNVACAGAEPMALTNCLNFGNPYNPEVYWTFEEAVGGIGDACRALQTPVTGGNVSFYNEHPEGAVYPTPVIGMLGLVEDVREHPTTVGFEEAGDVVFLLTPEAWQHARAVGGSEYLARRHGRTTGDAPALDLEEERAVQQALLALIRGGYAKSAHDVSDGGLAVALAESVIHASDGRGAAVELFPETDPRLDALLFGERQSRVVFSTSRGDAEMVGDVLTGRGVRAEAVGRVTDAGQLRLEVSGETVLNARRGALAAAYEEAIPAVMGA
jgi:phosphoribosylformylglycinamidine synthase